MVRFEFENLYNITGRKRRIWGKKDLHELKEVIFRIPIAEALQLLHRVCAHFQICVTCVKKLYEKE